MMRLRFATEHDINQMLSIKSQLVLNANSTSIRTGGFLLGSTYEQYLFFICNAYVLILEDVERQQVAGFAIGIGDTILRQTDLWERKNNIQWSAPIVSILESQLGYFEQMAILPVPAYRHYAAALVLAMAQILFEQHDFVLTTVVHKPVQNLASLPLLKKTGAQHVGYIEEDYPQVGKITSSIYCVDKPTYQLRFEDFNYRLPIAAKLFNMIKNLT